MPDPLLMERSSETSTPALMSVRPGKATTAAQQSASSVATGVHPSYPAYSYTSGTPTEQEASFKVDVAPLDPDEEERYPRGPVCHIPLVKM